MSADMKIENARFVPNPAGMRELATRAATQATLDKIAQTVAQAAAANGGRFSRRGWGSAILKDGEGVYARAGNDRPAAHWDEWGNRYRTPRAPLRRALHSLGLWQKTKPAGKP